MKRLAVLAGALMLAACGQEEGATTGNWTGDVVTVHCCTTFRLPSPGGTKTLIFEPDGPGEMRVILSAGWLRREEIAAAAAAPVLASWGPHSQGVFLSGGRHGEFRLFHTPDNGPATELTGAPGAIASAYRTQAECPAASGPEVRGLGWSADGRRVLVLASAPSCGFMVMDVDAGDGRVLELYGADEAVRRFPGLMPPAAAPGVTAP